MPVPIEKPGSAVPMSTRFVPFGPVTAAASPNWPGADLG
jgi:hypothetical protein